MGKMIDYELLKDYRYWLEQAKRQIEEIPPVYCEMTMDGLEMDLKHINDIIAQEGNKREEDIREREAEYRKLQGY